MTKPQGYEPRSERAKVLARLLASPSVCMSHEERDALEHGMRAVDIVEAARVDPPKAEARDR